jgi:hypothetical protein
MINAFLKGLTPLERDCKFKIHCQELHGEPIDPAAKRDVDEAEKRFAKEWQERRHRQERSKSATDANTRTQ